MARDDSALADRLALVLPHLDERQRRVVLGAEARTIGRGGIGAVARAAGVSEPTVSKAVKELEAPGEVLAVGRARRPGGGRKSLTETDPGLVDALEALVDPATRGDPKSPLRWSSKSTRELADVLGSQGHRVSHVSVGLLLRAAGYSLQAAAKTREGRQHPDRDGQFRYLTSQVNDCLAAGDPVISVDTKKKLRHEVARSERARRQEGRPMPDA